MAWVLLLVAGLLEIVWACTTKLSHGLTTRSSTIFNSSCWRDEGITRV
jgi:multidrug transporter EmrE-like cation transporter